MEATINIIIVNWNAGNLLRACLNSIQSLDKKSNLKTFVVDNSSSDGSEKIAKEFSGTSLIQAGENLGFGKACNLGAKNSGDSDYLLFLNPDAALYPDSLKKAVDFMQNPTNAKVGICGVQLMDESGHVARSCARFPSVSGFVAQAIGLDKLLPQLGHFMTEWTHDSNRVVDQVIGAFFLVRRSLFDSIGGFDERFFVYFEEVDFSFRARQAGWSTVYLADVQAFHAGGGTSNQVKARRLFYFLRSRLLYVAKHFSFTGAALVFTTTLLVEPFSRSTPALIRCSWSALRETWQGYAMLSRWLQQWMFKGVTR